MYARIHDEGTEAEVYSSYCQFKFEAPTMTLSSSCISQGEDLQSTATVSAGRGCYAAIPDGNP